MPLERPGTAPVVRQRFEILHDMAAEARSAPRESREPPPWLVNAPNHVIHRSSSLANFMPQPPQQCIRRRDPCPPPVRPLLAVEEPSQLFTTSHKIHFAGLGKPRRRDACLPRGSKGLFSEVAELGLPTLTRTTSAEHFQQRVVPVRRAAYVPPANRARTRVSTSRAAPSSARLRARCTFSSAWSRDGVSRYAQSRAATHSLLTRVRGRPAQRLVTTPSEVLIVPKQRAPCVPPRNDAHTGPTPCTRHGTSWYPMMNEQSIQKGSPVP